MQINEVLVMGREQIESADTRRKEESSEASTLMDDYLSNPQLPDERTRELTRMMDERAKQFLPELTIEDSGLDPAEKNVHSLEVTGTDGEDAGKAETEEALIDGYRNFRLQIGSTEEGEQRSGKPIGKPSFEPDKNGMVPQKPGRKHERPEPEPYDVIKANAELFQRAFNFD